MTYEEFSKEVNQAVNLSVTDFGENPHVWVIKDIDLSIAACECAAEITGNHPSNMKVFNKAFRDGITEIFFNRAVREIAK